MIPVVVPIVGAAFPAWFLVLTDQNLYFTRERRKHTKIFKYLAPKELAQEIDRRQLGELGLQGKSAVVTTLFCQLQDFVSVIEQKSPEAVIHMLDGCISVMMSCVYEHNGLVTRLSNYGVMAIWGAPLPSPEESQCRLAASCAVDIQQKLLDLTATWRRDGRIDSRQSLTCWFGVSTGEAACGQIGSESHIEYSVVGRSVDLSVLLESLNKRYGTKCLISERTAQLISQHFECRELDKLKIEQHDKPQYIHELFCQKDKLPGAMDEAIALYKQGLAAIEERNFEEAERLFSTILRLVPDERPAALMLERCREYLRKPPEPDWDGAILMADIM
jgi:adenylate cyclase